ncbi:MULTISPECIES: nickel pincer cofactor biosynthesis protein LarC [Clostridium]|uniref:Pyridinium-3,5-bisthiocarboxylic acid mononucleotide nickel insertion protein n=1 Tax=Clostridium beijerinckii TaxID=1520 RepID=A0A1S9N5Z3_CLOBE|nr:MULTISPECIES: nickel pincer cofactor biosynthesis protein LarC [Clostridium]MBN7572917.1 nickel pincer cofactor biosynthesis protein LarC [Clostridium beijerinckii]MBN7578281.1 nickel pincer cofactor biosynthesis protein LarC [Clostridium beijerinckii]MBN7582691.1 nickel pincer cofactor biosynthesis protein LarC [Clostridium beijerinckii]MBO0520387.1 nickel pincer cofactor biosynthesis protein LarC [Clostridium beijerinckii]MZK52576.1 nickel pincer cofactor biosynthesis protein LarC [Clostr
MRILYYDCFCGISGDMNLAAMLNLGVPKEYLFKEISKLNLNSEYDIQINSSEKLGITGTRVDVILKDELNNADNIGYKDFEHCSNDIIKDHSHSHVHDEEHNHHDHSHGEDASHNHEHNHPHSHEHDCSHNHEPAHVHNHSGNHEHHHRNLKDIENIINSSDLSEKVKNLSLNMFMRVAEAEAKVHGKTLYEVHFHEVGAIDSIVDIVGAAICLDYLKVDKIMASHVQVGGGFVKCAHGLMPVPAPATVEILKGIPINVGVVQFETTTPTGAAILAENVQEFTSKMDFSIKKIGYGIGHRDLDIPNVLRVYLGEDSRLEKIEEQYILETNIDDMNPEFYGYIEEKLFDAGALDVFKTPIFMKKGRPGIKLSILISEKIEKDILDIIFEETTSIGVRKYKVEKIMLNREFSKVETQYGEVTIKKSYYKGNLVKYKPEYEECKKIAKENNITMEKVYREVYKQTSNIYNE